MLMFRVVVGVAVGETAGVVSSTLFSGRKAPITVFKNIIGSTFAMTPGALRPVDELLPPVSFSSSDSGSAGATESTRSQPTWSPTQQT
jgi:hypothetical protein